MLALLATDPATRVAASHDEFGYTWIAVDRPDADLSALVTALHAVNATLADAGFDHALLCTVIGFAGTIDDHPRRLGLVYLFKRGTVYPFAPTSAQTRDTALELRVRACLANELPIEPKLDRWFPIWAAPGL